MIDKLLTIDELIQRLSMFAHEELHVHHTWKPNHSNFTGSNHQKMQDGMRNFHMKTNGWGDIAQHVTLFPDGKFLTGRNFGLTPISIKGFNTGGFCVEMVGDFDIGQDTFEGKQKESMLKLAAYFDSKKRYVRFHNENATKTCPGTGINKATFMKEARAYLVKPPVAKPTTKPVSHTVQKGETFYGIAKQYSMSASDLQKFNPRVTADDLQIGDVIHLIPVPVSAVKPPVPVAPKPVPKPVTYTVPSPPLKEGDKNARVMQLQKALNAAKFSTGTPDGSFGPNTTNALKRFQSVYANPSDGSYGPKTRDALHKLLN